MTRIASTLVFHNETVMNWWWRGVVTIGRSRALRA